MREETSSFYIWTPPLLFFTNAPSVCVCVCADECAHVLSLSKALAQSESQKCIFNRAFPPGCQPVHPSHHYQHSWWDNSPADAPVALPTQPTPSTCNLLHSWWWVEGGEINKREEQRQWSGIFWSGVLHKAGIKQTNLCVYDSQYPNKTGLLERMKWWEVHKI